MKDFLYSRNAVYEALRAGRRQVISIELAEGVQEKGRITDILDMTRQKKIPVRRVPRGRLDRIHEYHQGVAAEVGDYPYVEVVDILEHARGKGELPFVLILDSLQDPQNLGTLLRTAEAVGAHGIILPLARTVEVTPAVVNASSGASEHLLISRSNLSQAMEALKQADVWLVGLDQDGMVLDAGTRHLRGAVGLVVGSEGEGLHELTRKKCDVLLRLPMRGEIESLNAAVAGSVALYFTLIKRL